MTGSGSSLDFENFKLLGTGGFDLSRNAQYSLRFTADAVELDQARSVILPSGGFGVHTENVLHLPFSEALQLLVEDRRTASKAAGPTFFGGGFGLAGAAQGMAMAAVLRGLSGAFTRKGSVIGAETAGGYFVGEVLGMDVWTVRQWLSARSALRTVDDSVAATADSSSPHADSWLEQLERVTKLHREGALSVDEFAAAKAKLLRGPEPQD